MTSDVIRQLQVLDGKWYVDATFGQGGHTQAILQKHGNVIAFDFDTQAITSGQEKFSKYINDHRLILVRENFNQLAREVQKIQKEQNITEIDGVVFDLGTSTEQLMAEGRGFSFDGDGPLDMRLDERLGVSAADLLAVLSEKDLIYMFQEFGGEREAKSIARTIVDQRKLNAITTTKQLSDLVSRVKREKTKLHPATKVFQALRIVVNDEIANVESSLPQALEVVKAGGRIVTIAFHQGEDKVSKTFFRQWEAENNGKSVFKKPLVPSELEIKNNPRSRSAKMRVFEKQ